MVADLDKDISLADNSHNYTRVDSNFVSNGILCAGWLYTPDGVVNPPVILIAHGFAGERAFGLEDFAEAFVKHGYAAFVFDYRTFGDSGGTPRNIIDPIDHGQDWDAAIEHVRTLADVDHSRMILWGSSFSGSHVICAAARDGQISATISQVPFSGIPVDAPKPPLSAVIKITLAALWDKVKTAFTGVPYYVPVVGPPGSSAVLNTPECEPGYRALIPPGVDFPNRTPAQALLKMAAYDPVQHAKKVHCPALVIGAEQDSLVPIDQVRFMASHLEKGEFHSLGCNHFEPYKGEWFDKNIRLQLDFLNRHFN